MSCFFSKQVLTFWLLTLLVPTLAANAALSGTEGEVKGSPALPGQPCTTLPPPELKWTLQEQWVWRQLCIGKSANFNDPANGYGGPLDPKNPQGWPKSRILRPAFLETILLHEPYRGALTHRGVHIEGAWIVAPLDLSSATLAHPLVLESCRCEGSFNLAHLRTPHLISLAGSIFTGELNMDSIQVGGSLLMSDKARFGDVILRGAHIGGQLDMTGATVTGKLNMNGIQVDGPLFMRAKARFGDVILRGAHIGGQLSMDGATVTGELDMESIQVGGQIFLRNAQVTTTEEVDLIFAKIGSNLDISGSTLPSLDLTGSQIKGDLRLGSGDKSPQTWQDKAQLTLHNTEVGALQDQKDAWPLKLELNGFVYGHLGGFETEVTTDVLKRDAHWFTEEWLAKQRPYSPQPYEQLAEVLRKAGQKDKAEDILYASKERERTEVAAGIDWPSWVGLTLLKRFIGYGYRTISYILLWVLFFTGLGTGMLMLSKDNPFTDPFDQPPSIMPQWLHKVLPYWVAYTIKKILPPIAYSFDRFVPIIRLREYHYTKIDLRGWVAYYFYFHQVMGFVLASLLIAGITGLTAK